MYISLEEVAPQNQYRPPTVTCTCVDFKCSESNTENSCESKQYRNIKVLGSLLGTRTFRSLLFSTDSCYSVTINFTILAL